MVIIANIENTDNSVTNLPAMRFNGLPIITTELLAQLYGTETIRIQQNHKRNDDRFIAGKHFFKLEGVELSVFKKELKALTSLKIVSGNTRHLILWTERGAARHAKMLETDQAWDVFEKLEDFYFSKKQMNDSTPVHGSITGHTEKLDLLRSAVNMLADNRGISYQRAYSLVHKQFGVRRIEDIEPDRLSDAVAYSYKEAIEGEFVGKEQPVATFRRKLAEKELNDLIWVWVAAKHMLDTLTETESILRKAGYQSVATVRGMIQEYPATLLDAVEFLRKESDHIVIKSEGFDAPGWGRILPVIRSLH